MDRYPQKKVPINQIFNEKCYKNRETDFQKILDVIIH